MKKSLLTALLIGVLSVSYCMAANAASVTLTKPTVQVNTSNEESALTSKINKVKSDVDNAKAEQEKKQAEAKAKQEQREKEAKAKQEQRKTAVQNLKNDTNNSLNNFKNSLK